MTTCTARDCFADLWVRCKQEAKHSILAGCVHEHVYVRTICAKHKLRTESSLMLCRPCRDSEAQPHDCVTRVIKEVTPLSS